MKFTNTTVKFGMQNHSKSFVKQYKFGKQFFQTNKNLSPFGFILILVDTFSVD